MRKNIITNLPIIFNHGFWKYFCSRYPISSQVCFMSGQNCTQLIVNIINAARKQILVQAYSFTSMPIAKALVDAKRRGVDVKIILDKSQIKKHNLDQAFTII